LDDLLQRDFASDMSESTYKNSMAVLDRIEDDPHHIHTITWTFHPNFGKEGPKRCDLVCTGIRVPYSAKERAEREQQQQQNTSESPDGHLCMLVFVERIREVEGGDSVSSLPKVPPAAQGTTTNATATRNDECDMSRQTYSSNETTMSEAAWNIRRMETLRHLPVVARQFDVATGMLLDQNPEANELFGIDQEHPENDCDTDATKCNDTNPDPNEESKQPFDLENSTQTKLDSQRTDEAVVIEAQQFVSIVDQLPRSSDSKRSNASTPMPDNALRRHRPQPPLRRHSFLQELRRHTAVTVLDGVTTSSGIGIKPPLPLTTNSTEAEAAKRRFGHLLKASNQAMPRVRRQRSSPPSLMFDSDNSSKLAEKNKPPPMPQREQSPPKSYRKRPPSKHVGKDSIESVAALQSQLPADLMDVIDKHSDHHHHYHRGEETNDSESSMSHRCLEEGLVSPLSVSESVTKFIVAQESRRRRQEEPETNHAKRNFHRSASASLYTTTPSTPIQTLNYGYDHDTVLTGGGDLASALLRKSKSERIRTKPNGLKLHRSWIPNEIQTTLGGSSEHTVRHQNGNPNWRRASLHVQSPTMLRKKLISRDDDILEHDDTQYGRFGQIDGNNDDHDEFATDDGDEDRSTPLYLHQNNVNPSTSPYVNHPRGRQKLRTTGSIDANIPRTRAFVSDDNFVSPKSHKSRATATGTQKDRIAEHPPLPGPPPLAIPSILQDFLNSVCSDDVEDRSPRKRDGNDDGDDDNDDDDDDNNNNNNSNNNMNLNHQQNNASMDETAHCSNTQQNRCSVQQALDLVATTGQNSYEFSETSELDDPSDVFGNAHSSSTRADNNSNNEGRQRGVDGASASQDSNGGQTAAGDWSGHNSRARQTRNHDENAEECDFVKQFVDQDEGRQVLDEVSANFGHDVSIETQLMTRNKGPKWFSIKVRTIKDPITSKPILIFSARDISSIMQAAKEEADRQNIQKSEFFAVMAHEIRTPLHQVIGFIELLASTPLNEEQTDFVDMLQSSTHALMAIINDLLDFTKLEAGKMKLEAIPFEIKNVLQGSIAAVTPQAEDKHLKIDFCMNTTSAEGERTGRIPVKLLGDPNRLRQIVLNMLTNAIKFTSEGFIRVTATRVMRVATNVAATSVNETDESNLGGAGDVLNRGIDSDSTSNQTIETFQTMETAKTSGKHKDDNDTPEQQAQKHQQQQNKKQVYIRFTVEDTGIGMTPEQCDRIFNAYQQADSSVARQFGGTGLGLAICKSLVEAMDGDIGVASVAGQGTTFWFEVPFERYLARSTSSSNPSNSSDVNGGLGSSHLAQQMGTTTSPRPVRANGLPGSPSKTQGQKGANGEFRSPSRANEKQAVKKASEMPPKANAILSTINGKDGNTASNSATTNNSSSSSSSSNNNETARSLRVLVAEDNKVNQKVIANMLKRLGHVTTIVEHGGLAVEKVCGNERRPSMMHDEASSAIGSQQFGSSASAAQPTEYDIVLMDWQMPVMDGIDATKEIRSLGFDERAIPIVGLTASIQNIDWRNIGMNDCLKKPIRIVDLRECLEKNAAPKKKSGGE